MAAPVSAKPVSYAKWDNFCDSSDEEGEREPVVAQGIEGSAAVDFEHARRVQELDEEVVTDTAQLAMLRKQRAAVTEAIRAQSASTLPSSQWMLIGGSSFAKVPSKQVADTLNKGAHSPRARSGHLGLRLATPDAAPSLTRASRAKLTLCARRARQAPRGDRRSPTVLAAQAARAKKAASRDAYELTAGLTA